MATARVQRLCARCWGSSGLVITQSRSISSIAKRFTVSSPTSESSIASRGQVRNFSAASVLLKKTVVEDVVLPDGWGPTNSIKYNTTEADEGQQVEVEWSPTGTGGYPEDWSAISETPWNPSSQRVGLIGIKLGMTHTWDVWGDRVPLTAIQIQDNVVIEERTETTNALVVAAVTHTKAHNLRKSLRNMYTSKDVSCRRHVSQFKVSPDAMLPQGTVLNADHFVPGQYIDVISKTIGKGTAGVMKRHNMKGGNASHGATKHHRKMGATGGGQDPGRIWPGKRMAGHMGDVKAITHSLKVFKIDTRWNVVYVKGAVSGKPGAVIKMSDARRKQHQITPPFPTAFDGQVPKGIHVVDVAESDPTMVLRG